MRLLIIPVRAIAIMNLLRSLLVKLIAAEPARPIIHVVHGISARERIANPNNIVEPIVEVQVLMSSLTPSSSSVIANPVMIVASKISAAAVLSGVGLERCATSLRFSQIAINV